MTKPKSLAQFMLDHATPEELRTVLGTNWAICRNTERNRQRYGRCITRKEYQRAEREALDSRDYPNTTITERAVLRAFAEVKIT